MASPSVQSNTDMASSDMPATTAQDPLEHHAHAIHHLQPAATTANESEMLRKSSTESFLADEPTSITANMAYSVSSATRRTTFNQQILVNASTPSTLSNSRPPVPAIQTSNAAAGSNAQLVPKDIAQFLIAKDYLLTALEFYTELCEDGVEIRELKDFFADHKHFETMPAGRYSHGSSILGSAAVMQHGRSISDSYSMNETVSSADEAHSRMDASEQAEILREKDEYIAVLEYELRQAKDASEKLRTKLSNMIKAATEESEQQDRQQNEASRLQQKTPVPASKTPTNENNMVTTMAIALPSVASTIPITEEKRVLNYLVNEYLKQQCYKMTTLTFADENDDQDLEDWEDITGVPRDIAPPPPNMMQLYRNWRFGPTLTAVPANIAAHEPDQVIAEAKTPSSEIPDPIGQQATAVPLPIIQRRPTWDSETASTRPSSADLRSDAPRTPLFLRAVLKPALSRTLSAELETDAPSQQPNVDSLSQLPAESAAISASMPIQDSELPVHKLFKAFNLGPTNAEISSENMKAIRDGTLSETLGSVLPRIIPNVIINKREELLPILVSSIVHVPNTDTKSELISHLISLMKRPDNKQRQAIIDGCLTALGKNPVPELGIVILRHINELCVAKSVERRLLAGELCGRLSTILRLHINKIFVALATMIHDINPEVRFTACKNLALIIGLLDLNAALDIDHASDMDEVLKKDMACLSLPLLDRSQTMVTYHVVCALVVLLSQDGSSEVYRISFEILFPVIFDQFRKRDMVSSFPAGDPAMHSPGGLLEFTHWLLSNITVMTQPKMEELSEELAFNEELKSSDNSIVIQLVKLLDCSIQHLHLLVLVKSPFDRPKEVAFRENDLFEHHEVVSVLQRSLHLWIGAKFSHEFVDVRDRDDAQSLQSVEVWPELQWLLDTFVRMLMVVAQHLQPTKTVVFLELSILFRSTGQLFGEHMVKYFLRPTFESHLDLDPTDNNTPALKPGFIPLFICGLSTIVKHGTSQTMALLKTMYLKATSNERGWIADRDVPYIQTAIHGLLCLSKKYLEHLILNFVELTSNDRLEVRYHLPSIVAQLIPFSSQALLLKRIIPWTNQLANDNDRVIRVIAVPLYGSIIESGGRDREVWEKLEIQLSALLDDPLNSVKLEALLLFSARSGYIDEQFRDSTVLPMILRWATMDLRGKKPADDMERVARLQLCLAALHIFRSIPSMTLGDNVVQQYIIPTLSLIKKELPLLETSNLIRGRSISAITSDDARLNVIPTPLKALGDVDNTMMNTSTTAEIRETVISAVKEVGHDHSLFSDALESSYTMLNELISVLDKKNVLADTMLSVKDTRKGSPSTVSMIKGLSASLTKKSPIEPDVSGKGAVATVSSTLTSAFSRPGTAGEDSTLVSPFKKATSSFFGSRLFQKIQERTSSLASSASSIGTSVLSSSDRTTQSPIRMLDPTLEEKVSDVGSPQLPLERKPSAQNLNVPLTRNALLPGQESELTLTSMRAPTPTEVPAEPSATAAVAALEFQEFQNQQEELQVPAEPMFAAPVPISPEQVNNFLDVEPEPSAERFTHQQEDSDVLGEILFSKKPIDFNTSVLSLSTPFGGSSLKKSADMAPAAEPLAEDEPPTKPKNFFDFDEPEPVPLDAAGKSKEKSTSVDFIIDTVYPAKEQPQQQQPPSPS